MSEIFKWSIVIVAGVVSLIYVIFSIYGIVCNHKYEKSNNYYLIPLLGAMMVLVILSLCVLLFRGVGNSDTSYQGTFLSLITLTLTLASIIPFIVTKALTEREVNSLVSNAVLEKQKTIFEQVDRYVDKAMARIHMSDSDDSRLIGYLLMTKSKPDYVWSLSWLMRALIFYKTFRLEQQKLGQDRELDYFYITQCFTFIRYDLLKILHFSKEKFDLSSFLKKYDKVNEKTYTANIRSNNYTSTICRVQNHILGIHESIQNNEYKFDKMDFRLLCDDLLLLLGWLIVQIDNYLNNCFTEDFKYSKLHSVNMYEIHFKQEEEYIYKIKKWYNDSYVQRKLEYLKNKDLSTIYPFFETEKVRKSKKKK